MCTRARVGVGVSVYSGEMHHRRVTVYGLQWPKWPRLGGDYERVSAVVQFLPLALCFAVLRLLTPSSFPFVLALSTTPPSPWRLAASGQSRRVTPPRGLFVLLLVHPSKRLSPQAAALSYRRLN